MPKPGASCLTFVGGEYSNADLTMTAKAGDIGE
jgi:hypothetical protein